MDTAFEGQVIALHLTIGAIVLIFAKVAINRMFNQAKARVERLKNLLIEREQQIVEYHEIQDERDGQIANILASTAAQYSDVLELVSEMAKMMPMLDTELEYVQNAAIKAREQAVDTRNQLVEKGNEVPIYIGKLKKEILNGK